MAFMGTFKRYRRGPGGLQIEKFSGKKMAKSRKNWEKRKIRGKIFSTKSIFILVREFGDNAWQHCKKKCESRIKERKVLTDTPILRTLVCI